MVAVSGFTHGFPDPTDNPRTSPALSAMALNLMEAARKHTASMCHPGDTHCNEEPTGLDVVAQAISKASNAFLHPPLPSVELNFLEIHAALVNVAVEESRSRRDIFRISQIVYKMVQMLHVLPPEEYNFLKGIKPSCPSCEIAATTPLTPIQDPHSTIIKAS